MKLGLLQGGTSEEIFKSGASVIFFPHGLGHHMGLEVHDVDSGGLFSGESMARWKGRWKMTDWWTAFHRLVAEDEIHVRGSMLLPGMVFTVEPGIYFNRWAIEEFFLKEEEFKDAAKYVNRDLLSRYYPVGGVRIEDDILVTETGFENLTTAPKGEAALKIINEGKEDVREPVGEKKKGWCC